MAKQKVTKAQVAAAFRTIRKHLDQIYVESTDEICRAYKFVGDGGAGSGEELCEYVEALSNLSSFIDNRQSGLDVLQNAEDTIEDWIDDVKNARYDLRHMTKK